MTIQLDSRLLRVHSIVVDHYGIDPLLDITVPKIQAIPTYAFHKVTQAERGAPDLIAYINYGSEHLYWVLSAYNGLCLFSEYVEGLEIKIPDYAKVITVLATSTIQHEEQRVITI